VGGNGSGAAGGGGSSGSADGGSGGGGGGEIPCDKAEDCTSLTDACNQGDCIDKICRATAINEGLGCDDQLFCSQGDICMGGVCTGVPTYCPDQDPCNVGKCDEDTDSCTTAHAMLGTLCDDFEPCTTDESCVLGKCSGGSLTDCSMLDSECTAGACKPGLGCVPTPVNEAQQCNVANNCAGSFCADGKCVVQQLLNLGQPCDDGLFCTKPGFCSAYGTCVPSPEPTCPKPAECIDAVCDEVNDKCDVVVIANGNPCEDGDACTGGETCNNNVCTGGTAPVQYFADDFSQNAGWALGNEWQIGPAAPSVDGAYGPDPAADHAGTVGGGVAGVVIGGNAATALHAMEYLTSPAVDVSAAPGKVVLTYYRWLNSDYTPYMRNVVEVFDGAQWVEVWASGTTPIWDSPPVGQGWTFMSHDVTAYKNAGLMVRFGFEVGFAGVYSVGSWNLDDVKLLNTGCPF
jgi:hypothetical protein